MKQITILLLLLPLLLLGGDYGQSRYAIGKGKLQVGTNLTFNYGVHSTASDPSISFGFGDTGMGNQVMRIQTGAVNIEKLASTPGKTHFNTFHPSGTGFTIGYGLSEEHSVGINFQMAQFVKIGSTTKSQFLGTPVIYYSSAIRKREVSIVFSPYVHLPFITVTDPDNDKDPFTQPFEAGMNLVLGSEGNIPEVGEILINGHYRAAENSAEDAVFEFGLGLLGGWRYNDTDSIKGGVIYQSPNVNATEPGVKTGLFEGTYALDILLDLHLSKVGQLTMDLYYVLPLMTPEDTVSIGFNLGFKATF